MHAIIQAGGIGTRLKAITGDLPKPLVPLAGRAALFRLLDYLKNSGVITRITVLAGYRGQVVEDALHKEFGSGVKTIIETTPMGSGGCLSLVKSMLDETEEVVLLGGDLLIDLDLSKLIRTHRSLGCNITITVHGNSHPLDADIVVPTLDGNYVKEILVRPHPKDLSAYNIVNAAITVLNYSFFEHIPDGVPLGFEKDILIPYLKGQPVGVYLTNEYIQDLGTPARLALAESWLADGQRHSEQKHMVLVDPGVLTEDRLIVTDAIRKIYDHRYGVAFSSPKDSLSQIELKRFELKLGEIGIPVGWRDLEIGNSIAVSSEKILRQLGMNSEKQNSVSLRVAGDLSTLLQILGDL